MTDWPFTLKLKEHDLPVVQYWKKEILSQANGIAYTNARQKPSKNLSHLLSAPMQHL